MALSPHSFQKTLLLWFDTYGRKHLPWQQNKTPYRVWVSEIMLQQTQVSTVIPYYLRFMERFPDLSALANAPEDDVLHAWAGLGYYSRARNLQNAARKIMNEFAGQFPETSAQLQSLPGIGRSTAGAILALAFNQQAPILDGNVKRVLTRLHGMTTPVNEKTTEMELWELASLYTPSHRVADYTQAMMDLGATFCTRSKPQCLTCPFTTECKAHQHDLVTQIPAKKNKRIIPVRSATFLILKHKACVLLLKRPPLGIWGGLFSLPQLDGTPDPTAILTYCRETFRLTATKIQPLATLRHTFSHYHLDIHPMLMCVKEVPLRLMEESQQIWYNIQQPEAVGLPKPVQTLLRDLI